MERSPFPHSGPLEADEVTGRDDEAATLVRLLGGRVQEAQLSPGDSVQVGPVIFVLQVDGVPADDELSPVTLDAAGAEELWCLGDLVGYGAEPDACVQLAETHCTICLAGNHDLAVTGARTARDSYGARGWVAHHNTDLWRATGPIDAARYGMWPTGGAWLCKHLWDAYDYGRDRALLAELYPVMKGAAEFFLDTLVPDPSGRFLVTSPSISPPDGRGYCECAPCKAQDNPQSLEPTTGTVSEGLTIAGRT